MSDDNMMNIRGCCSCVRQHFYDADHLQLKYTLPVEAYQLHRELNYQLCQAWDRFAHRSHHLSVRECILLAEAWFMAVDHFTGTSRVSVLVVDAGWVPNCNYCRRPKSRHEPHKDNNPENDPPDRWVCDDGKNYKPIEYKLPMGGKHPKETP